MTWQPRTYEEGLRMAWDEDDDGVDHCLSYIEPHVPHGYGRVLDYGCGVGRLTIPLAKRRPSAEVWGYDPSSSMIRHAKRVNAPRNVTFTKRLYNVPPIDFVFSVVTFQHMTDDAMRAVLKSAAEVQAKMVFQFVEGFEREPLSMQRPLRDVTDWCMEAGFTDVSGERDGRFPNWWWMICR